MDDEEVLVMRERTSERSFKRSLHLNTKQPEPPTPHVLLLHVGCFRSREVYSGKRVHLQYAGCGQVLIFPQCLLHSTLDLCRPPRDGSRGMDPKGWIHTYKASVYPLAHLVLFRANASCLITQKAYPTVGST